MLKLPEYAKRLGISRQQAYLMYKNGTLPHKAEQIGPRTIIVNVPNDFGQENKKKSKNIAYIRVSSKKQESSLVQQKLRVLEYCANNDIKLDGVIEEIASGMNGKRTKLNKILSDPNIETIVVEHRERLSRINFELIENTLKAQNRKIFVIDNNELEDDLIRDITEVLTSFCARFYGARGAKVKAEQFAQEVAQDVDQIRQGDTQV